MFKKSSLYHYNPITGKVSKCYAKSPESCPFGAANHNASMEEIMAYADRQNELKIRQEEYTRKAAQLRRREADRIREEELERRERENNPEIKRQEEEKERLRQEEERRIQEELRLKEERESTPEFQANLAKEMLSKSIVTSEKGERKPWQIEWVDAANDYYAYIKRKDRYYLQGCADYFEMYKKTHPNLISEIEHIQAELRSPNACGISIETYEDEDKEKWKDYVDWYRRERVDNNYYIDHDCNYRADGSDRWGGNEHRADGYISMVFLENGAGPGKNLIVRVNVANFLIVDDGDKREMFDNKNISYGDKIYNEVYNSPERIKKQTQIDKDNFIGSYLLASDSNKDLYKQISQEVFNEVVEDRLYDIEDEYGENSEEASEFKSFAEGMKDFNDPEFEMSGYRFYEGDESRPENFLDIDKLGAMGMTSDFVMDLMFSKFQKHLGEGANSEDLIDKDDRGSYISKNKAVIWGKAPKRPDDKQKIFIYELE